MIHYQSMNKVFNRTVSNVLTTMMKYILPKCILILFSEKPILKQYDTKSIHELRTPNM